MADEVVGATPPDLESVKRYLNNPQWSDTDVEQTLLAEIEAQRHRVVLPDEGEYPADLQAALMRRVAHALAVQPLPLGLSSSISEAAVAVARVGGSDAEVERLEAPHRRFSIA